MPIAWVLNLDADEELRHPSGYTPSAATTRLVQRFVPSLQGLVRAGDVILDSGGFRAATAGAGATLPGRFVGQAWCPTPSALACLRHAGVLLPATPHLEVLRLVNHRTFCARLEQTLEQARYVRSFEELTRHVGQFPITTWLLKRPHGFSGRGSRRVSFPHPEANDRRWIEASLKEDAGLQVEPWVERLRDFALHGYIDASGAMRLGAPTLLECGSRGEWLGTRPTGAADLEPQEETLLRQIATGSARALFEAGYFGPFGIDAYRWRDAEGRQHFNPRSEINARYTMGWHVGMGDWRPDIRPQGR